MNDLLSTILSSKRAHGSAGEASFRKWLWARLPSPVEMAEGCIAVTIGQSKTLFSCHVDTVHSIQESDTNCQPLVYDANLSTVSLDGGTSSCLGADDGAGIYVMLRMIEKQVPGTYLFHTGEERGGIGARAMFRQHADWLKKFKRAVAFDRAGTSDVVVTQGGVPCASATAGAALATALNTVGAKHSFSYQVSHKGTFTDTKVYAPLIPECFNLSVGYEFQHTPDEYLDVAFVEQLVDVACSLAWEDLPTVRVPCAPSVYIPPKFPAPAFNQAPAKPKVWVNTPMDAIEEMCLFSQNDFLVLVEEDAEYAAQVLQTLYVEYRVLLTRVGTLSKLLEL